MHEANTSVVIDDDLVHAPIATRGRPVLVWTADGPGDAGVLRQRKLLPSRRAAVRQLSLALADVAAVTFAAVVAAMFTGSPAAGEVMLATLPIWIAVAKAHDLYDADENKTWHLTTDELPRLFYFVTLSVALSWVVMSFAGVDGLDGAGALAVWATALGASTVLRTLARAVWRRVVPLERSVVIGTGESASRVTRKLQLERGHHLEVVAQIPHKGAMTGEDLRAVIANTYAHRVIVAVDELDDPTLSRLLVACRQEGVKLSVVPPMSSVLRSASRIYQVAEMPMVELPTTGPGPLSMVLKRTLDITVSSLLLVFSAPMLIALAIAVRLDSRGPAVFKQQRAGRGGKPFTMLKFRSMCVDAEDRLKDIVDLDKLDDPMFKLKADPRVTRVGKLLRATSLDELPQLWNVLRGDMSLVGPRPEETKVVDRYDEEARSIRLAMQPGLTGPMQIHGRGELTFDERLDVERDYVEHYSVRRDLMILTRTVSVVFFQRGAY